ncbi:Uncharacterized protein FKW44_011655, partial [Caligus rogercresseyi]
LVDTVIELLCAGQRPSAIIKLLKYPRTVYDMTKKWEKSGMSKRKEHKPRTDQICTPTFVAGLKRSIKANLWTPMSILAKKRWVHLSIVSRVIKKDLGYKNYALKIRHLLTDTQKARRVANGKKLLVSLKTKCASHLRFFSIEKVFT